MKPVWLDGASRLGCKGVFDVAFGAVGLHTRTHLVKFGDPDMC